MSEKHRKHHRDGSASNGRGSPKRLPARSSRDSRGGASTNAPRGSSKCLDALTIVLNQGSNDKGWFVSTKNLQAASLQFCTACREARTWDLLVGRGTPYHLWAGADPKCRCAGWLQRAPTRVPTMRLRGVRWEQAASPELLLDSSSLAGTLKWFAFGDNFNDRVHALMLPKKLETVVFGRYFNQPVDNIAWSASLRRLVFGRNFNQPVCDLVWPTRLVELAFGRNFNQPIQRAAWPATLRELKFGRKFNRSIDGLVWPASLKKLEFGHDFDRPIKKTMWPAALQRVVFGDNFNQAIDHVRWPTGLEEITFGHGFDHPIGNVDWPIALVRLTFGACFDQPLEEVKWPPSLQHLKLGYYFSHPLEGVKSWPSTLKELTLLFFPSPHYIHSLFGLAWPAGLKRLTVVCRLGSEHLDLPGGVEICTYDHYTDCCSAGVSGTCWYHRRLTA